MGGNNLDFFWILMTSGIPGFFSYWYLSKIQIMYFDETTKDEKVLVLSSLSLINTGISLLIFSVLFKKEIYLLLQISSYSYLEIISLFLITVLINFLLTVKIYPTLYEIIQPKLESYFTKVNGVTHYEKPMLKRYFENKEFDTILVVMFNFENKFIQKGEVVGVDDFYVNKLGLIHLENNTFEIFENYEDALNYYKSKDNNIVRLVLDYENKIKIFIFYFNSKKTKD